MSVTAQRLAWHGFAFDLPSGWEVTAYRLDAKRGEFRLHERLRERGQLTWVRMPNRPDPQSIASEILARQVQSAGRETVRPTVLAVGDFAVFHAGAGLPFQALTWIAQDQRLLHWTFPEWQHERGGKGGEGEPAWMALLRSFRVASGDARTWALFGLSVDLPHAFTLRELEAGPGTVSAEFTRADGLSVTVRRWALARPLLEQRPLASWMRRSLVHGKARIEELAETSRSSRPAAHAEFSIRGERPIDRVAWRRWYGEAWWWHRVDENRICSFEQVGPPGSPRLEVDRACPF